MTIDTNTEYGEVNINSKGMVTLQTEEQLYKAREKMIKEMYARLYNFGLKTEEVRNRLDKLSMFFGNIGSVSNMSDDEIAITLHLLEYLALNDYKFHK
jgi:hypothetical protein